MIEIEVCESLSVNTEDSSLFNKFIKSLEIGGEECERIRQTGEILIRVAEYKQEES